MIPREPFGRTGHVSTRTIFGGAALWRSSQEDADRTLDLLLEFGVNHIDVAASYGDAELRIGPWMAKHRSHFFLATKTLERSRRKARDEFHRSLERLRVDSVDLLQLHHLVDPVGWQEALGPDGALEAAVEARQQGLTRFIGVTGHGLAAPAMHRRSLERFAFDSVLFVLNYPMMQDPQYAADVEALITVCRERGVAVQTIKSVALGPWNEKPRTHRTWYEPLHSQDDVDRAVHWVLGHSGVFLNTAGDTELLPKVLDAASRFQAPPPDEEMRAMAARLGMTPLFV